MGAERADELVEIALDDAIELVEREPDAVIGDAVLRVVVGADLLRALARADHAAALGADGGVLLLALDVEQAAAQDLHRLRLVLELRALVLALDDHARRHVHDLDGAVRRVDALPAGAARCRDVDLRGPCRRSARRPLRPRAAPRPSPSTCGCAPASRSPARAARGARRPRSAAASRRPRR